MVDGFRMIRRIVEARPWMRYGVRNIRPVPGVKTDEEILSLIRNNRTRPIIRSAPAGWDVRPMRSWTNGSKCYGLEGLRVADASIFPTMPSGNTNAPPSWWEKRLRT